MPENIEKLIDAFRASLERETFVKLTLGHYRGTDEHLQKLQIRRIDTRKGKRLLFLYRSDFRDIAKNFEFDEAIANVKGGLGRDFFSAHLFTIENDFQLDIGKGGRSRLNRAKPTFRSLPSPAHDREKKRYIDSSAYYLKALGITNDEGRVRDRAQDKWRQINKFVEILDGLFEHSSLADSKKLRVVDMGSGKGYLTFAAYDHFKNSRDLEVEMTGVDLRPELVELCNEIARTGELLGLRFVRGSIQDHEVGDADILIALHACNTATDEAIFKGIQARASIIVAAPCCHQELRPQIRPPEMFRDVLKHGIMMERTSEFVTDSLRSLLLERSGYATKIFEFVSIEHTPKNLMLVGTRIGRSEKAADIDRQIVEIKQFYGLSGQRLETLLHQQNAAPG
jgi:hypothetical protein